MNTKSVEPAQEGTFHFPDHEPFRLEAGGELQPVSLRYAVYGTLNPKPDNVVLVCHALSGAARVADWWNDMFAPGRPFDLSRYCVIGTNVLGSCYGSTGPTSINPRTGIAYGPDFPLITVGDMVRAQARLLDHLGVERVHSVIGGSIGGMQALQWAIEFPDRVQACVAIGATPVSAMALALNHIQRLAIQSDANWNGGRYTPDAAPTTGLGIARAIAMCSYKSAELLTKRFARRPNRDGDDPYRSPEGRFDVAGYLDYQRAEFNSRFDANTYITISKAMDVFDLERSYGSEKSAFARILARVLMIGISTDWLFPPGDVRAFTARMQAVGVRARYVELVSSHGHDGFLADVGALSDVIKSHDDWLSARPALHPHSDGERLARPASASSRLDFA